MRQRQGFSLLEIVVACSAFLLLVVSAFRIFEFGAWAASTTNQRHNLQSAATRAMLSLQNDLLRSAFASVGVQRRSFTVNGINVQRDGISLAAMSDWNDPAGFDPVYGTARYDRHLVYYATSEEQGRVFRCLYAAPLPRSGTARVMENFQPSSHLQDNPAGNSGQLSFVQLAGEVREFSVTTSGAAVRASLVLFRAGLRGGPDAPQKRDQSYQFAIEVVPLNTWPRD